MRNHTIKNKKTGLELFSGQYESFVACLENAVTQNIDLSDADLRGKNLSHANLDSGHFTHADFAGSNLIGANLSEAHLDSAIFAGCSMESACLAFSSLRHADFTDAQFGGTDIAGTALDGAKFSTLSSFHLNFTDTESMHNCRFINPDDTICIFSTPPCLIHGLARPVIMIGQSLKIGDKIFDAAQIRQSFKKPSSCRHIVEANLYRHRHLLQAIIQDYLSPASPICPIRAA